LEEKGGSKGGRPAKRLARGGLAALLGLESLGIARASGQVPAFPFLRKESPAQVDINIFIPTSGQEFRLR